jgi:hypothetical protein
MQRKIIFFDIDGTLLSEKTKRIPASAVEAIHKAQKNGHLAVVNTGRTAVLLEKELLDIGFDGFICGCGTKIIYRDEILFHHTLEDKTAQKVMKALRKYKIDGILEGDENLYLDARENLWSKTWVQFYDRFHSLAKPWSSSKVSMDKLYVLTNEQSDIAGFQKELGEMFDFVDRERGFFELVPCGYTKASGILQLIGHLGMELCDTISIGDSNNDLSMLTCTAVSIAMGVHSEGLEKQVDYVTKTVEEDGIYHALSHYGLI